MTRHKDLLTRSRCGLLIIDIQEKFIPAISDIKDVFAHTAKLIQGFKELDRPILVTEQYPEGLGTTCKPVRKALGKDIEALSKISFSCNGIDGFIQQLRVKNIHQIVICGIETHVCVWQTAMDLLHYGFHITIAKDAVSSRKQSDRDTALERMVSAGIHVSTTEMILFELLETADDPLFKSIQALIK